MKEINAQGLNGMWQRSMVLPLKWLRFRHCLMGTLTFLFFTAWLFYSCGDPYKESAKRSQNKKLNNIAFTLTPLTHEALAEINYGDALERMPSPERDSILGEYKRYSCYILDIEIKDFSGSIVDYRPDKRQTAESEISDYYKKGLQNYFELKIETGHTLPCTIFYDERQTGLPDRTRLIAGFRTEGHRATQFDFKNPHLDCGAIQFNLN